MFIVHSVGSNQENPFQVFIRRSDAAAGAEDIAKGNVERVFVYQWTGDLREGLTAARKGQLQPIMHYPHREAPRVRAPEPPVRLSKKPQDMINELIRRMPRIARRLNEN